MSKYSLEKIRQAVKGKGYRWFENGSYNVNIVGIRNADTEFQVTNKFDDLVTLSYRDHSGEWQYKEYTATTDPGTHWEQNLLNPNGVAILKEGQFRGAYKIGLHQGKYKALRQQKPLPVYRDKNKDGDYDLLEENIQEGIFGINIHRATSRPNGESTQVDKWSAGCQVIASYNGFEEFMEIVEESAKLYGNSFTYTLLNSNDL